VIRKLVTVGQGFYRSLSRVRRRGGQAYLGIESFVHIHPALLLGFEIAGDYVEVLPEAARLVGRAVSAGDLKEAFTGFPTTFGNIIEAINSIEIPHEIIPMDMVLSLLLDLIVDRLGSKQKAVGKGILFVLDQLGFIPKGGESFDFGNFRFSVVEMDGKRVARVKIQRVRSPENDSKPANAADGMLQLAKGQKSPRGDS